MFEKIRCNDVPDKNLPAIKCNKLLFECNKREKIIRVYCPKCKTFHTYSIDKFEYVQPAQLQLHKIRCKNEIGRVECIKTFFQYDTQAGIIYYHCKCGEIKYISVGNIRKVKVTSAARYRQVA